MVLKFRPWSWRNYIH